MATGKFGDVRSDRQKHTDAVDRYTYTTSVGLSNNNNHHISFISGNVAHRTQKKIGRQNRTNIKQAHTHTHTNTEKKEKQIVEFSMQQ